MVYANTPDFDICNKNVTKKELESFKKSGAAEM